jgi:pimeloyl-ACP methyl ester carboxylesterase
MSEWVSDDLDIGGVTLCYHRRGGDGPTLVLAHGFTDDGLCWTRLARDLEADYDLIAFDARGHGRSSRVAPDFTGEMFADDLAALIETLGLNWPGILGHSMGAFAAAGVAAKHPDLPGYVILEDPPLFAPQREPVDHSSWAEQVRQFQAMTRDEVMALCREESPDWDEAEVGPWADSKLSFDLNLFDTESSPSPGWQGVAEQIRCPALLITADPARGAIVTPETAQEAEGLLQNGRVAHIDGAGHNIHREQYGRFLDTVKAFLSEQG